jgi:hypothetical protein
MLRFDSNLIQKANKTQLAEQDIYVRNNFATKAAFDGVTEIHAGRL